MKNIIYLFLLILTVCFSANGQEIVSGYVYLKNPNNWEHKVQLSKVQLDDSNNSYTYTPITAATISEEGYFTFDQKWFDNKDQLYKIHIDPIQTKSNIKETITNSKLFIVSKNDSIYFKKGVSLFDSYTTNNKADLEWQELKKFESKFDTLHDEFDTEKYLLRTKGYVKDSLQILLVKLLSIKKLDDKQLLEKDIKKNTAYYTGLLKELKSSEIDPALFLYLENKLSLVYKEKTDEKYSISMLLNGVAGFIILILVFFIIRKRRNRQNNILTPLSKQEKTIKALIISGKSNKEIANELFISISTVKTHISNIYSKLNISSRKELLIKK
ncbi:response regulator transcription factor [Aquimarina sp. 2201CG14-23]|uniref:response regulator transcription factor n=1 Tax=Aquimarina mycalae TaxID=3040073 RepID=UPI002477F98C|nr:response regulator transcription factor [Aquimarina sp. 2201CG14-23]MDH7446889.1 response regulator transcription factor [Aquimarina sp. 2201CG14-23]